MDCTPWEKNIKTNSKSIKESEGSKKHNIGDSERLQNK